MCLFKEEKWMIYTWKCIQFPLVYHHFCFQNFHSHFHSCHFLFPSLNIFSSYLQLLIRWYGTGGKKISIIFPNSENGILIKQINSKGHLKIERHIIMNYHHRLHVGKGFCYAAERHEPARCSMHPAEQGMSTMPLSHWLTFGNTFLKIFAAPFMSAFVIVPS